MNGEVYYADQFRELIKHGNSILKTNPELKSEIKELIDLCQSEIEEGGSVEHEIELCKESINQLINEDGKRDI
jgi:hypothetical protein